MYYHVPRVRRGSTIGSEDASSEPSDATIACQRLSTTPSVHRHPSLAHRPCIGPFIQGSDTPVLDVLAFGIAGALQMSSVGAIMTTHTSWPFGPMRLAERPNQTCAVQLTYILKKHNTKS